jgi:hypothetical protein
MRPNHAPCPAHLRAERPGSIAVSPARTFALVLWGLLCACDADPQRPPGAEDTTLVAPQLWPPTLSDEETARCAEVAWCAVTTPGMWARCGWGPAPTEPLELSESGIQYTLDRGHPRRVEVQIRSGTLLDWHAIFIGVTVARGSFEVMGMREIVKW